jgi:hypothetical protein
MGGTIEDTPLCRMPPSGRPDRFPALPHSAALRARPEHVEGAGSIGPDGGGIIPIHAVALKR